MHMSRVDFCAGPLHTHRLFAYQSGILVNFGSINNTYEQIQFVCGSSAHTHHLFAYQSGVLVNFGSINNIYE